MTGYTIRATNRKSESIHVDYYTEAIEAANALIRKEKEYWGASFYRTEGAKYEIIDNHFQEVIPTEEWMN